MDKRSVATSGTPKITLEVSGSLTLKGWEDLEVLARCPTPEDLTLEQRGDEVAITCQGDCTVRVPFGAILQVNNVSSHASLKSLEGDLAIKQVSGHLTLRSIGTVTIDRVSGHLAAKNITGDLKVTTVEGNAAVRDVQGDFIVADAIQGNLTLSDVDGDARAIAHGNAALSLDPAPGNSYTFEAGGNLLCRIPADASVQVEIPRASSVLVKIPGIEMSSPSRAPYSQTLGEGDATLTLSTGGEAILASLPPDWDMEDIGIGKDFDQVAESISQQVTHQIEAQMEMLEHQLESQLDSLSTMFSTSSLLPEQAERITQRAREASERASTRAQEKIQRAQEKLQRKLEAARRRAEMRTRAAERAARDRRKRYEPFDWSPAQPQTADQSVTDEERLMVLQMLEQQKITIEEAEQLLAALEGKASGD